MNQESTSSSAITSQRAQRRKTTITANRWSPRQQKVPWAKSQVVHCLLRSSVRMKLTTAAMPTRTNYVNWKKTELALLICRVDDNPQIALPSVKVRAVGLYLRKRMKRKRVRCSLNPNASTIKALTLIGPGPTAYLTKGTIIKKSRLPKTIASWRNERLSRID